MPVLHRFGEKRGNASYCFLWWEVMRGRSGLSRVESEGVCWSPPPPLVRCFVGSGYDGHLVYTVEAEVFLSPVLSC